MSANQSIVSTQAEQLHAAPADWRSLMQLVERLGGIRCDRRGDDRWKFPDGSVAMVRGLTFAAKGYSRRRECALPTVDLLSPEAPLFQGNVLDAIGRLTFVFAKTMPDVPHEYTVRLKAEDDADYVAIYDCIMRDGVIAFWRGCEGKIKNPRPARYLCPGDGWWYWSMSPMRTVKPYEEGRHPLFLSHHVNRCTLAAWDNLIARGWIFTDGQNLQEARG